MISLAPDLPCPCGRCDAKGRALRYAHCCAPWLKSDAPAPDAHALMRSRYSAFVLECAPYLLHTWHASTRPQEIGFEPGVVWLGLEVREFRLLDAAHAEVEFVARQRIPGARAMRLHERSRFVREQGRWYYLDGQQF